MMSMRPSWPPPRMPSVDPGLSTGKLPAMGPRSVLRAFADRSGLAAAKLIEAVGEFRVGEREYGGGEERRVDRAGFADREGADRNAGRHLHDGEQAVLALERRRIHRHAENGQRSERSGHAGKVRGAAGARDHDLEALLARGLGEFEQAVGRAMRRHDQASVADAKLVERRRREAKRFPVGLATHDDRDRPLSRGHSVAPPWRKKAADYRSGRGAGKRGFGQPRTGLIR